MLEIPSGPRRQTRQHLENSQLYARYALDSTTHVVSSFKTTPASTLQLTRLREHLLRRQTPSTAPRILGQVPAPDSTTAGEFPPQTALQPEEWARAAGSPPSSKI